MPARGGTMKAHRTISGQPLACRTFVSTGIQNPGAAVTKKNTTAIQ